MNLLNLKVLNNILLNSNSQFNLANLFTFINISSGLIALYLISVQNYFLAIILAWIGGAFDIFDGKIARKFNLSNEFGIQIDSFADFISFVLVPTFLIFKAVFESNLEGYIFLISGLVSIFYVISGLRRLIFFNINSEAGNVENYFEGVPTPLGAIFLWLSYLAFIYLHVNAEFIILFISFIAVSLNSKVKVKHL